MNRSSSKCFAKCFDTWSTKLSWPSGRSRNANDSYTVWPRHVYCWPRSGTTLINLHFELNHLSSYVHKVEISCINKKSSFIPTIAIQSTLFWEYNFKFNKTSYASTASRQTYKTPISVTRDARLMDETVGVTIIRCYESEPFTSIIEFDMSGVYFTTCSWLQSSYDGWCPTPHSKTGFREHRTGSKSA